VFETTKSESMFGFDLKDKIWSLVAAMPLFRGQSSLCLAPLDSNRPPPMQGILTPEQLTDTIAAVPLLVAVALIFGWKRWLGRRRHVDGKARLDKVVIYVAELEGDDKKGSHRTNIIRSLQREMSRSHSRFFAAEWSCAPTSPVTRRGCDFRHPQGPEYLSDQKG